MSRSHLAVFGVLVLFIDGQSVAKAGDKASSVKQPFTITTETTRITEPVDKDGFIDYAAALNDRLSKSVNKENNAVVLLCQMFGPKPEGQQVDPEFYKRLGIDEPPEKSAYFVTLSKFLDAGAPLAPEERARLRDAQFNLQNRPWKAMEFPRIAAWLLAMKGPIGVGVDATRRSRYYHPLIPQKNEYGRLSLMTSLVSYVQKCRELANALALRAMLHLGEGRNDAAWQDLAACHRLARLVTRGGSLIENLVGMAVEHIASEGTLSLLEPGRHDRKQLHGAWSDWRALSHSSAVRDNLDLTERYTTLETVLMMQRYGPEFLANMGGHKKGGQAPKFAPMKAVAWDPALKNINAMYDRIGAALKEEEYQARRDKVRQIEQDIRAQRAKIGEPGVMSQIAGLFATPEQRGERMGDIIICLLIPAFTKLHDAEERTKQLRLNMDTAFALAAYHLDHDNYPTKLAELSPRYLERIPADHFTGKPLTYRTQAVGYVLYSFGLNERDDEGRTHDDDPPGDDIVVRMPRPLRRE